MGYAVAEAARARGASVTLVSGPVALEAPEGVRLIRVESASEMKAAMDEAAAEADVIIMAAAVADYRAAAPFDRKIKKDSEEVQIALIRNDDILAGLGKTKRAGQVLVGFAAETNDVIAYASEKLKRKNADLFVANDVSRTDIGFSADQNEIHLLYADGRAVKVDKAPKKRIANSILDAIKDLRAGER